MSWECPWCKGKFYSSHRREKDIDVKCIYCNCYVPNPYYDPPQEDLRDKQIKALQKRVVELEAENYELKAQCAAMREALQEAISLLKGEKKFPEDLTIWGPGGHNVVRIENAVEQGEKALSNNAGKAMLERIAKLEAVTAAVEDYLREMCIPNNHEAVPVYKALAALEGGNEHE